MTLKTELFPPKWIGDDSAPETICDLAEWLTEELQGFYEFGQSDATRLQMELANEAVSNVHRWLIRKGVTGQPRWVEVSDTNSAERELSALLSFVRDTAASNRSSPPEATPVGESLADGSATAAIQDGVFGIDGFRFQGCEYRGLTPRAWKLLNAVWPSTDHCCSFEDAYAAIYGDDIGPEEPLAGPRKDANAFFRKHAIPLVVRVSGARKVGRVSIESPNGQK